MPEELTFEEGFRDGAAIDRDERRPGPGALVMDRSRQHTLSRPAFAGNQYRVVDRRHSRRQPFHRHHRCGHRRDGAGSARAARAITTLEVQRKTITREYGERIKKIKAVIMLLQQRESMGQLSLEGMDAIEITPELKKLIYNPVGDLS